MKLRNVNYRGRLAILTGAFCCTSLPMAALPTSVEAASPIEFTQQTMKVKGLVLDAATGEPVIGANVIVKGTTNGVITDLDGVYELNAPAGAVLQISFVGYKTIEVKAEPNM